MKRILFLGDSITDARRDRANDHYLGSGYATIVASRVGLTHPGEYEFINRGINGNRIVDLYARIKPDCIDLHPDIVSILIGINGVWHDVSPMDGVSALKYETVYDFMMRELTGALPDARFMILEPYVMQGSITCNCKEYPDRWEKFQRETPLRSRAARRIADKYKAVFVPLQERFDEACIKAPSNCWVFDGVHPTACGHGLIADAWIERCRL